MDKPTAFILMPFDEGFDGVYEDLIRPPLEEAGYTVARADTSLDQQNVMRDVVHGIANADLIVADVTGLNGNVMYELGLAHGLGRPTVILAQAISAVPFDLRPYRVQEYSTHFRAADRLRRDLRAIGDGHSRGELSFGSPVSDFGGGKIASARVVPTTEGDGSGTERPEGNLLDALEEYSEASTIFLRSFSTISAETAVVGEAIESHSAILDRLNESDPGATGARQYRKIALKSAKTLDDFSVRLEELLPEAEESSERIMNSGLDYITWLRDNGDTKTVEETRISANGLLEAVRPSMENVTEFRASMAGLRGISGPLTTASKRVTRNVDRIISVGERMESFAERTLAILEDSHPNGSNNRDSEN